MSSCSEIPDLEEINEKNSEEFKMDDIASNCLNLSNSETPGKNVTKAAENVKGN